jgi:alkanesulfonate monooxygenase SsuD/methylene tetrahydromethanopterin reductase-like flavin-dependent oxidoreductase (luciferase family)
VRFGVLMLPTDPWPETVERARRIEQLGYDHLWTYDHLSWRRYRGRPWFNSIPWLTGLAGVTSRVELGPMVTSPNFRHPVPLAQEAITLDHISNGRLVLGVGAGGVGFDASVFGKEILSPAQLVARLEEFAGLLGRLFAEATVSHAGAYYTVDEACVQPDAIRKPRIPIAIAASGNKSLGVVARLGDAWITLGDTRPREPDSPTLATFVGAQTRALEDACAAIDRDPSTVRRIFMIGATVHRPLASVNAFADFAGDLAEIGFTDVVFHHPRPDDPAWDEPEAIVESIASDVFPLLRD